jgi:hypothetical protein
MRLKSMVTIVRICPAYNWFRIEEAVVRIE